MAVTLQLQHDVHTRASLSDRTLQIAAMFGLSLEGDSTHTILPPIELTLSPGQLVFVTGVSGGGKSTLLRRVADELIELSPQPGAPGLVWDRQLPALPDTALVDALARPEKPDDDAASLEEVCRWLSLAGLNDAAVMLRRPGELSEGQRYRLRLAQAIGAAERRAEGWSVLLVDEFGSALDRTTAHALARCVRRWVSRSGVCLVAATAHDDLLEPLEPDVLIELEPGGRCGVYQR